MHGNIKFLYDVQFAPSLAHNLLSIGELMTSGYSIKFDNDSCVIHDNNSRQTIASVHMPPNRMFPLDVSNVICKALVVRRNNETNLWHLRYGHLNVNGSELLSQREMVVGLPKISELDFCA